MMTQVSFYGLIAGASLLTLWLVYAWTVEWWQSVRTMHVLLYHGRIRGALLIHDIGKTEPGSEDNERALEHYKSVWHTCDMLERELGWAMCFESWLRPKDFIVPSIGAKKEENT